MSTVRTHDKFYLNEDRKEKPKEYFKFIYDEVGSIENLDILDVGCATGDFLYFLGSMSDTVRLFGTDVDPELIDRAKIEVPCADFYVSDLVVNGLKGKYDIVFMNGVHSIFDPEDPGVWLTPLTASLKNTKSKLYVFGIFNPNDIDVRISSRGAGDEKDQWETGWNLVSMKTIANWCNENGFRSSFKDFHLGIDIAKNLNDPLRSFTRKLNGGERLVMNGLQLVHNFSLLQIQMGD